jgi:replication initiation protein RepC
MCLGIGGRVLQIYQTTVSRLPRSAPRQHIEDICNELQELHAEIRHTLESFVRTQKMSANESHSERHIQNSNTEPHTESEKRSREEKEASASEANNRNLHSLPARELPLGIVLDACPDVKALAIGGEIRHWRDFLAAAEVARPLLGVSPSAWHEACEAMGEVQAAITLSAILQRSDQINSAGGYLRNLTDKAREGKFSTWPMVMALLRAKLDASRSPAHKASDPRNEGESPGERLEVSDALLRSLKRPR